MAALTKLALESLDERLVPAMIDLTAFGANGIVNDALVHRMDSVWGDANGSQSYGRGQLRTVLTLGNTGVEQGYNTNARPIQSGMNSSSATDETRALRLDRVPVVTVGGTKYYEFVLNVNEAAGNLNRNISVDELRFYSATQGNLKNYNSSNFTLGPNATNNNRVSPVWDLDAGDATNALMVRAKINTAAVGEIAVLVPVSAFNGAAPDSFVYIYTKMGGLAAADGGVEEWGVRRNPPVAPPPATASVSGQLYLDNGDGVFGEGDTALSISFSIIVTDPNGNDTQYDLSNGTFSLTDLEAGTYQIIILDPFDYQSRTAIIGTGDGVNDGEAAGNAILSLELSAGETGTGYGFLLQQIGG